MKYLTLDHIRQHLLIDGLEGEEDAVLELYGSSAETTILNLCNRTIDDFIIEYGCIPDDIRVATLLLVGVSYQHREPASAQNFASIPYGSIDIKIKPYMRLASRRNDDHGRTVQTIPLGSDTKIEFWGYIPEDLAMLDVPFRVLVYNEMAVGKGVEYTKEECILTDDGTYVVLVDTDKLGVGLVKLKVTFEIPDEDFPAGYRREVVRINPYMMITG